MITGVFPPDSGEIQIAGYDMLKKTLEAKMKMGVVPEILFLDEPTSGLDVQSCRLIRSVIRKLNQEEITIFLTTHDINEANQLCDRIAIMNKGKIAAIDSPENLKNTFQKAQSVEVSFKGDNIPSFDS